MSTMQELRAKLQTHIEAVCSICNITVAEPRENPVQQCPYREVCKAISTYDEVIKVVDSIQARINS